ncbi:MAG: hypothetical protein WCG45_04775 [bacterium]
MPHPQMLFDLEECEKLSSVQDKTTFLITTGQAHINFLMWSIFSILIRSKVGDFLEHINVAINGPDERSGDPTLQNIKQNFLEDLRSLKWRSQEDGPSVDMPLTVSRVWSRVGAEQSLEMILPWVHTDSYIYVHDDIIWNTYDWEKTIRLNLYKKNVAIVCAPPLETGDLSWSLYEDEPKLNFPHIVNHCIAVRKPILAKLGLKWTGYHFQNTFKLEDRAPNMDLFLAGHRPRVLPLQNTKEYKYASYDVGAWVLNGLKRSGYEINSVPNLDVFHFVSMSWTNKSNILSRLEYAKPMIERLEAELKMFPDYWKLYNKYKSDIV